MNSQFLRGACLVLHGSGGAGLSGRGSSPRHDHGWLYCALHVRRVLGEKVWAYGADALEGSVIAARIPVNTELKCLSRSRSKRC
jgi:hypothetical protein